MISRCTLDSIVFFKQKTAYGMRISDWSSDVCSSDLLHVGDIDVEAEPLDRRAPEARHGVEFGARRQIGQHADDTHADFVFDPEITARQGNQAQAPAIFATASDEDLLAILIRQNRKSVVQGKSVSVRDDLGGRRIIKKKKTEKD